MGPETIHCAYDFASSSGEDIEFEFPAPSNVEEPSDEYAARLVRNLGFPLFLENSVAKASEKYAAQKEKKEQEDFFAGIQSQFEQAIERVNEWDDWYKNETVQVRKPPELSHEEVFSEAYHNLLHSSKPGSGGLVPVLQKEQATATDLAALVCDRDKDLTETKERHATEMQVMMDNLEGGMVTARDVNALAEKHHRECEMAQQAWDTQIRSLHETRREDFRSWILSLRNGKVSTPFTEPTTPFMEYPEEDEHPRGVEGKKTKKKKFWRDSSVEESSRRTSMITSPSASSLDVCLEESFTIQLGAQMKQTHNLRLLAANPFSLCRTRLQLDRFSYPDPMRMHTAMSLYSDKLHGVVLFVDNRISSFSGRKKEFAAICEVGPEFHFAPLEEQLSNMREELLPEALEWRRTHSAAASASAGLDVSVTNAASSKNQMTQGDFYVTTHSNLAQVHVVFHVVADNETVLSGDSISSRHPVILGLRNVLKACSLADITTLSIPLFLTPEMAEEMTIPWCIKRAELVFKCVKGFMMEMASWGGSMISTLQFLVPEDVTDSLFYQLAALLPSVFRVSNPLVMKSTRS